MALERWRTGEKKPAIPVATWNQFCDVAQKVNGSAGAATKPTPFGALGHALDVTIKNVSGADLTAPFPILRLTDPIFTPTDDDKVHRKGVKFKADTPDAETSTNFVVLQGPCASNKFTAAVIQGATWCKVNVSSSSHTHATAEAGNTSSLVSGMTGVRILWKESGTGVKWAVVLIGGDGSAPTITENEFDANEALGYDTTADGEVYNATGRQIWDGARSALFGQMILASESPESFLCKVADGATLPPATMADLEVMGDDIYRFPCGDDASSATFLATELFDPFGLLVDAAVGDYLYVRIMRGAEGGFGGPPWAGVVIRAQTEAENAQSGGGGGGDPWTGWPGPDPSTGVAPGIVFTAHVDETDPVAGSDDDFEFDDTTSMIGTAPASGTALNAAGRSFLPGETILVFGDATPTYHAFKTSENIALAVVNEPTGVKLTDTEFTLDGFTAIIGLIQATGEATNVPAAQYSNDQVIKVIFNDDAKWQPLETYTTGLFETTSSITARSGAYTWGSGTAKLLAKTGAGTHSETGATTGITIYNMSQSGIDTDRIVQCKKIDGQWFVDVDDC